MKITTGHHKISKINFYYLILTVGNILYSVSKEESNDTKENINMIVFERQFVRGSHVFHAGR